MPSPERPGTRPLPATAFLLKQISEANMPEVRGDLTKKSQCFRKFLACLFFLITARYLNYDLNFRQVTFTRGYHMIVEVRRIVS